MKNFTSKSILVMFLVICGIFLSGCSKPESGTNREAAATSAPAASPAASAPSTTASAATGVAECDAFLKAYEECVHSKVPAAQRGTFDNTLATWKKTWHDQAQNPQTKAALASVCKTSHDQARTSMKIYGCTF